MIAKKLLDIGRLPCRLNRVRSTRFETTNQEVRFDHIAYLLSLATVAVDQHVDLS